MKKYQLHTKTEDILKRFPALCKRLEGAERTPPVPGALCLGADLEKAGACLPVQCGLGKPASLGTLTRETVLSLLAALVRPRLALRWSGGRRAASAGASSASSGRRARKP